MAKKGGIGLDVLDKLVKKLEDIEKKVGRVEKMVNDFPDLKFVVSRRHVKNFERLGEAIDKISQIDGSTSDHLNRVSDALSKLTKVLANPNFKYLRSVSKDLRKFFSTLADARLFNTSKTSLALAVDTMRQATFLIDEVDRFLKKSGAVNLRSLDDTVNELLKPFTRLARMVADFPAGRVRIGPFRKVAALVGSLTEIIEGLAGRTKKLSQVQPVINTLNNLATVIPVLRKVIMGFSRFRSLRIRGFNKTASMVGFMRQIMSELEAVKGDPAGGDVLATFRSMGKSLRELREIQLDFDSISWNPIMFLKLKTMLGYVRTVIQALNSFSSLESSNNSLSIFSSLGKAIEQLRRVQSNFDNVAIDLRQFLKLRTMIGFIRQIVDAIDNMTNIEPLSRLGPALRALGTGIQTLRSLQNNFSGTNMGLGKFIQLQRMIGFVKAITRSVAGIKDVDVLVKLGPAFNQLANGVRQLRQLQGSFELLHPGKMLRHNVQFMRMMGFIERVVKVMTRVSRRLSQVGDVTAFSKLAQALSRLGSGIDAMRRSAPNINRKVVKQISFILRQFVKWIPMIRLFNGKSDALTNMAEFVGQMAAAMDKIEGLTKVSSGELDTVVGTLRKMVELSNLILRGLKNVGGDALKNVQNLPKLFRELSGLKIEPIDGDVKKLTRQMGPFTKLLKKLRNIDAKPETVKSLGELINAFSKIKNFALPDMDMSNLRSFRTMTEQLPKLVASIQRVKFDTRQINNLERAALAIEKLGKNSTSAIPKLKRVEKSATNLFEEIRGDALEGLVTGVIGGTVEAIVSNALSGSGSSVRKSGRRLGQMFVGAFTQNFSEIREFGDDLYDLSERIIRDFGISNLVKSEAFKASVEFDKLGTQLEIFGGLTEEQRQKAEQFAFEIGQAYPLSANNALDATLDLIKAGQQLGDVEFILPSAADLAALSDSGSLEQATQSLIAASSGFRQFTSEVEGNYENIATASDILASGADVSTASVESLSQGLANASASANSSNMTLQETVAILSILDQNAVKGAEGGTALRSVLNSLAKPSTIRNLEAVGIALYDPETGGRRPMADVIEDIRVEYERLQETSPASADQFLNSLADTYGRQGLSILLNAGEESISRTIDTMDGVAPASERAAASLDNLQGDVTQLIGSLETLGVAIIQPLLEDYFRPFVRLARLMVDGLLSLNRETLAFLGTLGVTGTALMTMIGAFGLGSGIILKFGAAIGTGLTYLTKLGSVFTMLLSLNTSFILGLGGMVAAFTLVVAVVGGLGAAVYGLREIFANNIGGATDAVARLVTKLQGLSTEIIKTFAVVRDFVTGLPGFDVGGTNTLVDLGEGIASFFNNISNVLSVPILQIESRLIAVRRVLSGVSDLVRISQQSTALTDTRKLGLSNLNTYVGVNQEDYGRQLSLLADRSQEVSQMVLGNTRLRSILEKVAQNHGKSLDNGLSFAALLSDIIFPSLNRVAAVLSDFPSLLEGVVGDLLETGLSGASRRIRHNLSNFLSEIVYVLADEYQELFGSSIELGRIQAAAGAGEYQEGLVFLLNGLFGLNNPGTVREAIRQSLDKLKSQVVDAIFEYQDLLSSLAGSLGGVIASPFAKASFVLKLFGLDRSAAVMSQVKSQIQKFFVNVFDVVLGLLSGMSLETSIYSVFGTQVAPLVKLFSELYTLVSNVLKIGQNFVFFLVDFVGVTDGIDRKFMGVIDRIANFIEKLNDGLFGPLADGTYLDGNKAVAALESGLKSIFGLVSSDEFMDEAFSGLQAVMRSSIVAIFSLRGDGPEVRAAQDNFIAEVGSLLSGTFSMLKNVGASFEDQGVFQTLMDFDLSKFLGSDFSAFKNSIDTIFDALSVLVEGTIFETGLQFLRDLSSLLGGWASFDTVVDQLKLLGPAVSSVLDSVYEAFFGKENIIVNAITALDNLIDTVRGLGDNDLTNVVAGRLEITTLVKSLAYSITSKVVLMMEAFASALDGIRMSIEAISEADSETIERWVTRIIPTLSGMILLFPAAKLFLVQGAIGGIGTALGFLATRAKAMYAAKRHLAGVVAWALIIKNFAENIDDLAGALDSLFQKDFSVGFSRLARFVGEFASGIVFDTLSLFGMKEFFGTTQDEIQTTIDQLAFLIENASDELMRVIGREFNLAYDSFETVFTRRLNGLENSVFLLMESLKVFIAQALPGVDASGAQASLDLNTTLTGFQGGQFSSKQVMDQILSGLVDGADPTNVSRIVRANVQVIEDAFLREFEQFDFSEEAANKLSGELEQLLLVIGPEAFSDMIVRQYRENPEAVNQVWPQILDTLDATSATTIAEKIIRDMESGVLDASVGVEMIVPIIPILQDASEYSLIDRIQTFITEQTQESSVSVGVLAEDLVVDMSDIPTVELEEPVEANGEFEINLDRLQISQDLSGQSIESNETIMVKAPIEVEPTEVKTGDAPPDVKTTDGEVFNLGETLDLVRDKLSAFASDGLADLTLFSSTGSDVVANQVNVALEGTTSNLKSLQIEILRLLTLGLPNVVIFSTTTRFLLAVQLLPTVYRVRNGFNQVTSSIIRMSALAIVNTTIMITQARRLANNVVGPLRRAAAAYQAVANAANAAAQAIKAKKNADHYNGGGRAKGGPVNPGMFYEVAEEGPELLQMGNRVYLMMNNQRGYVHPMDNLGGFPYTSNNQPAYSNATASSGSFSESIVVEGSNINIRFENAENMDTGAITRQIEAVIEKNRREQADSLRTRRRTGRL